MRSKLAWMPMLAFAALFAWTAIPEAKVVECDPGEQCDREPDPDPTPTPTPTPVPDAGFCPDSDPRFCDPNTPPTPCEEGGLCDEPPSDPGGRPPAPPDSRRPDQRQPSGTSRTPQPGSRQPRAGPLPPRGVWGVSGPSLPGGGSGGPGGGASAGLPGKGSSLSPEAGADKSMKKALDTATKNAGELLRLNDRSDSLPGPGPERKAATAPGAAGAEQQTAPASNAAARFTGGLPPAAGAQPVYGNSPAPAARQNAPGASPVEQSSRLTREAGRALRAGNPQAAAALATQALGQFPGNLHALNLRAMARSRMEDRRGAVADATTALKAKPDNVALLNTRAWALNGLGAHDQALQDAKQAATLEPNNPFAHLNVARAEGGLGNRRKMIEALRIAAGLDGRFGSTLQEALKLPEKEDTELLFQSAAGRAQPQPRSRRFLVLAGLCLLGGLLVTAGLLSVLSPEARSITAWRGRLGQAFGAPAAASERRGKFWEYFRREREIASGGMGVVYEAVDESLGRRVAVKQLRGEIRDDAAERERFLKEARAVAALHHPNIVDIYSIIEDGSELYMVLEYVEGKTLEKLIIERGRLPVGEAAGLMRGICAALQHAHEGGIVHRDLKPANIMITTRGEPKVADFGIARAARSAGGTLKLDTTVLGTPPYMAPEAEEGWADEASDVFSLGVCLYEMVTGAPPFNGSPSMMHAAKLAGNFKPPSELVPALPKALDSVVAAALAPAATARYKTPAALYAELARAEGA